MKSKNVQMAILEVMNEIEYLQKEAKQGIKYKVKSEEAVLSMVRPVMVKHGLIMYPIEHKDVAITEYKYTTFKGADKVENFVNMTRIFRMHHAPSDTFIDIATHGAGTDSGDKAGNGAMTVAKKYALLDTFLIVTGDDPDSKASPERNAPVERKQPITQFVVENTDIATLPHASEWIKKVLKENNLVVSQENAVQKRNEYLAAKDKKESK